MARSALMTGWAHLQLACPLFGHMLCAASWQTSPSRLNVPCLHCRLIHPLPAAGPNKGRLQTREQPPFKLPLVSNPSWKQGAGLCAHLEAHTRDCAAEPSPSQVLAVAVRLSPSPKVAIVSCHLLWCRLKTFNSSHSGLVDFFL